MLHAQSAQHTTLYRFDGAQFVAVQVLGEAGGRELCLIDGEQGLYLVRVCFITGTPKAPVVVPQSQIFKWREDRFELVGDIRDFRRNGRLQFHDRRPAVSGHQQQL